MKIFIILPNFDFSGPTKGAAALSNFICKYYPTYVFLIKSLDKSLNTEFDRSIHLYNLGKYKFFDKLKIVSDLTKKYKKEKIIILSMCFSADVFSLFLSQKIFKISSVRGNLLKNYFYTYGISGYFLAFLHLIIQNLFNLTLVMNRSMYKQVRFFSSSNIYTINNFIEEKKLSPYFKKNISIKKKLSFVFVGILNKRKDPFSLIKAFEKILVKEDSILNIVGSGPLFKEIDNYLRENNLIKNINLFGFLKNPYPIIAESDVFVLPSYSEGTPRAAMEALFLGIPCVLRDVEGNNELIDKHLKNGDLFRNNCELPDMLLKVGLDSRLRSKRENLLPQKFSENNALTNYDKLFKKIFYGK